MRFRAAGSDAWVTAHTRDIGVGGAFVECGAPPAAGTRLELEIEVPGADQAIALAAEVRWVLEPGTAERPAGMGVKFGALEVDALLALSDYFATLAGATGGGGEVRGP